MGKLAGVAADFCASFYNGKFETKEGNFALTTTAVVIAQNDPERASLTIINNGAEAVYVNISAAPTAAASIIIPPSGGSYTVNLINDLVLPSYQYRAAASATTADITVIEVRRYAHIGEEMK